MAPLAIPTARESSKTHLQWVYAQFKASLDPVQVTQMAKYLETVYVSGYVPVALGAAHS